jgi:hypothetical protein
MTEDSRLGQPSLVRALLLVGCLGMVLLKCVAMEQETKSVKGLPAFEELSALTSIPVCALFVVAAALTWSAQFFENLDPKNVRILTKSFTRKARASFVLLACLSAPIQTYEVGETVVQEGKAFFGFHVIGNAHRVCFPQPC